MSHPLLPRPTDAELEILQHLWTLGPSTVRDIHESMAAERPVGYTTVLKMLQIMTDKGLVERDASQRSHVFRPAQSEAQTQRQLIGDLAERAFGGSSLRLVMRALSNEATPSELADVRRLLDELDPSDAPKKEPR